MTTETKKKIFLEIYEALCEKHGMYIGCYCGEGPYGEIGTELEEATYPDEIKDHIRKLKETLD